MNRPEELTIVFRFGTTNVRTVIGRVELVLSDLGLVPEGFMFDGQPPTLSLSDAISQLEEKKLTTFNLVGQGYEFDLGRVRNSGFEFFSIKDNIGRDSWDKWATPFIALPDFLLAWVSDVEYQFWQNAYDPLQYKTARKPYGHLPMKSNGLPYPLEQKIIDTSKNPGRRIVRNGYYEVVGSPMWLGECFWALTGADRRAVEDSQWLQVTNPLAGVVRLQATARPFTEGTENGVELQQKLRAVLFPQTDV